MLRLQREAAVILRDETNTPTSALVRLCHREWREETEALPRPFTPGGIARVMAAEGNFHARERASLRILDDATNEIRHPWQSQCVFTGDLRHAVRRPRGIARGPTIVHHPHINSPGVAGKRNPADAGGIRE